MKLRNISCTQFAGIRDRSISFTDGINVVFGRNESGKSTLVNLLSRTLFQSTRLDRRSDKGFFSLYFPAEKKDGTAGDFADGKIVFETEKGVYTLSKEWGANSRCSLSTPNGVIHDREKINEALREALVYGEGVYSELLFSSQSGAAASLQAILDASAKSGAKQELSEAVARAFSESGSASADAIERAVDEKIDELSGKHWDLAREAPVRRTGRWTKEQGKVLKAYYALEDARAVLKEISSLEAAADSAAADYAEKDRAAKSAEEAYSGFSAYAGRLAVLSERKKAAERLKKELSKASEVISSWPMLSERVEKARALREEKSNRSLLDKYEAAKAIYGELSLLKKNMPPHLPEEAEIFAVKAAQQNISRLENALCGMNITADIDIISGEAEITSLLTGEAVEINGGAALLSEAVKISVPGVMEMRLSPADVDADEVKRKIAEQKDASDKILEKYNAKSPSELEHLARTAAETRLRLDSAADRLRLVLNSAVYEELEAEANRLPVMPRSADEIERDIAEICKSGGVESFVAAGEAVLGGYAAEYGSLSRLKSNAVQLKKELEEAEAAVSDAKDIPDEYSGVLDPEAFLETLRSDLRLKQSLREAALTEKTAAASRLEGYKDSIGENPAEAAERAERLFAEQKALLNHWLHIKSVFAELKENIRANPMQDIADSFKHNLGVISGGRVLSEFPEADKLNPNIYSGGSLLDYGKLSEGTKETVALSFRLAVLDRLFPNGGGIIVLDDPLSDMDADRAALSCRLIAECAERHQVVFLTCREEYADLLGGNRIDI